MRIHTHTSNLFKHIRVRKHTGKSPKNVGNSITLSFGCVNKDTEITMRLSIANGPTKERTNIGYNKIPKVNESGVTTNNQLLQSWEKQSHNNTTLTETAELQWISSKGWEREEEGRSVNMYSTANELSATTITITLTVCLCEKTLEAGRCPVVIRQLL